MTEASASEPGVEVQAAVRDLLLFVTQRPTRIYPIIQRCPELLSDRSFQFLCELEGLAQATDLGDAINAAEFRGRIAFLKQILARCRAHGLVQTFRLLSLTRGENAVALRDILVQHDHTDAADVAARVRLLERAVTLVDRDDNPAMWAVLQAALGWRVLDFEGPDTDVICERAAEHLRRALDIYSLQADPQEWANAHSGLGNATYRRTDGDRRQNCDDAIEHYECCLRVYTLEGSPVEWANTHGHLAVLYDQRSAAGGDELRMLAIHHAEEATKVFSERDNPASWAQLQDLLARAHAARFFAGARTDSLDAAMAHATAALRVVTRAENPQRWGRLQNLLGHALSELQRGDVGDNVQRAIEHFEEAARCFPVETAPEGWLEAQNGLAVCYLRRAHRGADKSLRTSIDILEDALRIATKEGYPYWWARLHLNLMAAFLSVDSKEAINHGQCALEIVTKASDPGTWALGHTNLAGCYLKQEDGADDEHLIQAIGHTLSALEVRTREAHPAAWAENQAHLANAFSRRKTGDPAENLETASRHFRLALEVYRPDQFPEHCQRVGRAYGYLMFEAERWGEAVEALETSLEAQRLLYEGAMFDESQVTELIRSGLQHHRLAYALARMGRLQEAATALERGRGRQMSREGGGFGFHRSDIARVDPDGLRMYEEAVSLQRRLAAAETPPDGVRPVFLSPEEATTLFRAPDSPMRTGSRPTIVCAPEHIDAAALAHNIIEDVKKDVLRIQYAKAQRLRQDAVDRIRTIPGFAQFEKNASFEDIARAVTPDWPLIFLVTTSKGSLALLLSTKEAGGPVDVEPVWVDRAEDDDVVVRLFVLAQEDQHDFESVLADTLSGLGQDLMSPVVAQLEKKAISRAVLIPMGFISLLPLHAARIGGAAGGDAGDARYVVDAVDLTYAVSARAISMARREVVSRGGHAGHLCAVGNPQEATAPLRFAAQEVRDAARHFPDGSKTTLCGADAKVAAVLEALPEATHIHFACHYRHDWSRPMESQLMLNNGALAVWEIQEKYRDSLRQARLVVLSACQSGISITSAPDESIGMPGAFIRAGIPAVVAALWRVDDLSSALLMSRFSAFHLRGDESSGEGRMTPARALCRAQCWLRDLSVQGLRDYVRRRDVSTELVEQIEARFASANRDDRPFAESPFDWAPFVALGM